MGPVRQARVPLDLVGTSAKQLPTRLLIAGGLLMIAFPALGGIAVALGYPAAPLPVPVAVVLGGLQLLIALYAAMVVVQLAVAAGAAVSAAMEKRGRRGTAAALSENVVSTEPGSTTLTIPPLPRTSGPTGSVAATGQGDAATAARTAGSMRRDLRALTLRLVEMIWEHEQRGRGSLERAILACVHDAVSTEIEHRRRTRELERRRSELEAQTGGRPARQGSKAEPGSINS